MKALIGYVGNGRVRHAYRYHAGLYMRVCDGSWVAKRRIVNNRIMPYCKKCRVVLRKERVMAKMLLVAMGETP